MKALQYLGVWHISVAVLFLCAHQSFIALCHEAGSPSGSTASSKQKISEGTDPSGSHQTDHAKVPSDDKKDNVNLDMNSDEDKDGSGQNKNSEEKPVVSVPGNSVSNKQDDMSRPVSQDSSGVHSSSQTGDVMQQQAQSSQQQEEDGVESGTGTKEDPGQENVQGVVLSEGGSEVKEDVQSVVDAQEEVSENTEAVEQIPVTKKPSTLPEIMDIPSEPLPAAAPATVPSEERSVEDKTLEETKQESSDGIQEVKDVEGVEPKDDKGGEPKEPTKEETGKEEEQQPKVDEESLKATDEKQSGDAPEEPVKDKADEEDKEKPEEQHPDGEQQPANDREESGEAGEKIEEGKEGEQKPPVEEEMPSFDEWKEKMLQEEEQKKREQGQATKSPSTPPARSKLFKPNENSKNHASSDCGAKLLATNKEAQSATAILNINPDLYMLNPCSANIKFVVELCEPIQIKQIEIANYELFSSVPEKFRVSISDRYPAREWHQLGIYVAQNERVLQSFPVPDEQMFAKYMKFEMLSFFGSEHYCPLSVLRVFGTNVVEEIEDADTVDDVIDTPPEYLPVHPTPLPDDVKHKNGLLESAKDVVFGLVRRAAKVLAGREDADWKDEDIPCFPEDAPNNHSGNGTSDGHPSDPAQLSLYEEHLEICMPSIYKQCVGVDIDFSSVRQICRGRSCCFCPNYAERFEYCRHRSKSNDGLNCCCTDSRVCGLEPPQAVEFKDTVDKVEPPPDVAEDKDKVVVSDIKVEDHKAADRDIVSDEIAKTNIDKIEPTEMQSQARTNVVDMVSTESPADTDPQNDDKIVSDNVPVITTAPKLDKSHSSLVINVSSLRDIEPTKTQAPTIERTNDPNVSSNASVAQSVVETKTEVHKLEPTVDVNQGIPPAQSSSGEKTSSLNNVDTEKDNANKDSEEASQNGDSEPIPADKVEDKVSKVPTTKTETTAKSELTQKPDASTATSPPATQKASSENGNGVGSSGAINSGGIFSGQQKESVFMRLNNRIKDLELNMSLSSRYLEELSQRYKKQMDEMQKAFNKTITTLTENAQTAHNRDTEQQKYIDKIENQLAEVSSQLVNTTQRLDNVLREVIERHLFLMVIEILTMSLLFLFCIGRRPSKIYIPVENGVLHTMPHSVQNHVGHRVPADVAKRKAGDVEGEGRAMHASPQRRNRSLGECTPAKASATNTGGDSCDDLLIIGHTTPYLEALQQSKSPDGEPRRKGKHKSHHKVAPKSSSTTAVPLTNGEPHAGTRLPETNQAGLLFKDSASKGDSSPEARGY